ncbi:MAG: cadherin-like beta sandwich domain-containing protein [Firmicutes bacterium]|nr:cadherin-like beta sandwich domain-containing protein [Bacillota bacterium]
MKKFTTFLMAAVMTMGLTATSFAGTHVVQEGEWLSTIAPKYDTTWQNLAETNKLANPDLIYPDQVLQVPDKGTPAPAGLALEDLSIYTAVQDGADIDFAPGVKDYEFGVQSDIYGVKVVATAPEGATLTINGEEAESGVAKVVAIDGSYANYDVVLETPIDVVVEKDGESAEYTINVVRDCDTAAYALFEELTYTDAETGETIPYMLYVPSNYDASKEYPIVLAYHGSGQRSQTTDMVLKRYQMATVWAKDSEAGHNECIVLAPHCATADGNENWTTLMQYRNGLHDNSFDAMPKLTASYNLLLDVMDEYSVDEDRVYMTGLSAGGFATYTLAIEHPETFAALAPDAAGADPAKVAAIADIPTWIFHAEDDPTVNVDEYLVPTLNALDAAGANYKLTMYKPGTVFGTSAHFSWVPMYADKEFRDWLFAQKKAPAAAPAPVVEEKVELVDLSIYTAVQDGKDIAFAPATTGYEFGVQSDCYGVKVVATAPEGATVTINGEAVESGVAKVVAIDGSYANYDVVLETPIEVVVTKGEASKAYTINVVRDCDTETYALFEELSYTDAETGETIPYMLYVPTTYDANKEYPLVLAYHGSGQRSQTTDMVLKRYQMATVWAKDSEAGINECIVLAPHCATADGNENWTTLMQYRNGLHDNSFDAMPKLTASYNLLLDVMEDYSVDADRVYMTGLSAGGFATYTLAIEHPETFAALAPDAAGADPAKVAAIADIPMWIFHAEDDPTVAIAEYLVPTLDALDAAGSDYKLTMYAPGTVFGTSAHFSWVPMYADKEFRNWLFAQSK